MYVYRTLSDCLHTCDTPNNCFPCHLSPPSPPSPLLYLASPSSPPCRLILDGPASSRLLQSSVGPSSLPTQYTSEATTTRVPAQRKLVFSSSDKCWHKQQKRHTLLKRAHSPEEETPASHVLGRHHHPKVRLQQVRVANPSHSCYQHNPQSFVGP